MSHQYQVRLIGEAETEELEKLALNVRSLLSLGRTGRAATDVGKTVAPGMAAGTGRLIGAAGGAALGAGTGAAVDEENRTRGAILGALGGAAVGTGVGQLATKAGRTQVKQFGQRQLHGFTGYLPGQGLTGVYKMKPEERVKALEDIGWTLPKKHEFDPSGKLTQKSLAKLKADDPGMLDKAIGFFGRSKWKDSKAREKLLNLRAKQQTADLALAEQGLTSLPGGLRGYALGTRGTDMTRLQQVKANLLAPGLALGAALPAASAVGSGVEYAQTGDEKQLARDLVDTVGYSAFAGLPILPALASGEAMSRGTGYLLGNKENNQ